MESGEIGFMQIALYAVVGIVIAWFFTRNKKSKNE